VERLHDSAKNAQELNGDCKVALDTKLREGRCNQKSRLPQGVMELAALESSEALEFGPEFAGASRLLQTVDWMRSSQVVRISLEDAIRRKAIGSPD